MKNFVFLAVLTVLLGGCTIQKRVHLNGYYVSWNKSYSAVVKDLSADKLSNDTVHDKSRLITNFSEKSSAILSESKVVKNEILQESKKDKKIEIQEEDKTNSALSINRKTTKITKDKVLFGKLPDKKTKNSLAEHKELKLEKKNADMITLGLLSSLSLLSFLVFRKKILTGIKIASWAQRNKKKAQVFLVTSQIAIAGLGLLSGFEFADAGYEMSNLSVYGSMALLGITLATHPSTAKMLGNKKRYLGSKLRQIIFISTAFALCQNVGMKWRTSELEAEFAAQSVIESEMSSNEQSSNLTALNLDTSIDKSQQNLESPDPAKIGLYYFLIVLLGVFMAIASCATGCLVGLGLWGSTTNELAIGAGVLVGLICLGLTIFTLVVLGGKVSDLRKAAESEG